VAPLITHLVVGERVYRQLDWFGPADHGAFLLGWILVDVHLCSPIHRRETHFADAVALVGRSLETAPGLCDRPR
jgi:hypothetical protein